MKKYFASILLMALLMVWLGGIALAAAVDFAGVCDNPPIDAASRGAVKCSFYPLEFEYIYGDVYVYGDSFIRKTPDLYGSKLGVAYKGAILGFLGDVSTDYRGVDWYRVVFGNSTGWISSMYTYLEEDDF